MTGGGWGPWVAGLTLIAVAASVALAVRAAAHLSRVAVNVRPDPSALERLFQGDLPTLVLAADSSCGACRRALADVGETDDLRAAGLRVETVLRGSGPRADSLFQALGPGPVPVYALVELDGRLLGIRRGYQPPVPLRLWVRSALVAPSGGGIPLPRTVSVFP